ncbi:MAG: ComEC/Rec2 family competence protein [Phycisphaerales bacterium]
MTPPDPAGPLAARSRAVAAFACFALGIALARELSLVPSPVWFAIATAAASVAYAARGWACRVALMTGALALGAGILSARVHEPARDSIERLAPPDAWLTGPIVRVEGTLESDPRLVQPNRTELDLPMDSGPGTAMIVRVWRTETPAGWTAASGRVRVFARADVTGLDAGDGVRVTGSLAPLEPPSNPGAIDFRSLARSGGFAGSISVPDAALVERAEVTGVLRGAQAAWFSFRADVRARSLRALGLTPGDPGDALVGAIVLGYADPVLDPHVEAFRRVGVAHLLAISGFHIAVLAGLALVAVRASGDRGWLEPAIVMLVVLLYVFVLPAKTPILRSAMMVLLLLGAETAGRRYDRLTVLAWAGVALLIWRPLDLFNIGYQLSMSITAVLLAMGEHERIRRARDIRRVLDPSGSVRRVPRFIRVPARWVLGYGRTCVACWLVAAPIIMAHLHVFSPLAPLATMLTMPLVLITLQLGYLAALVGIVVGPVGFLSGLAGWMGARTVEFVSWTDALDWASVRTGPVSTLWALVAACVAFWAASRWRWRDPVAWALLLAMTAWAFGEMRTAERPGPAVALRIDAIDVGNGSCYLIRSGDRSLLWDAGSLSPGIADRVIDPALRALGMRSIDAAVITHANLDHFNALPDLAASFGIDLVYTTDVFVRAADANPRSQPAIALDQLREQGVRIETLGAGDTLTLGSARVDVLWPPDNLPARGITAINDTSLVARFAVATSAGERSALMTGDIQAAGILGVMASLGEPARADVIEMPHHGSVSFEAAALIEALDPAVVLQSTGPDRAREPAWAGLQRGRSWWVTAEHGAAYAELGLDGSVTSGAMIERR